MPAFKNKTFPIKKLFLVFLGIIIAGGLIWYFKFRSPSFIKKSDPVKTSEDQVELIGSFGYPDVFMLTIQDENRYEIWTYYDMERSFTFYNGKFMESQVIESLSEDFQFPDFRPTQFKNDMAFDEVVKILGDPTVEADISPTLIENAKVYDYWDQVKVGTKDDKVTYVETLPVFIPEKYRVNSETP